MDKTEQTNPAIRPLQDAELDLATGGVINGDIRMLEMREPFFQPTTGWTFKDVFTKYTIGR